MKKIFYFLSAATLGTLLTVWYSCEKDPEESCKQDEICEAKFVTACCTDNDCVYKYNGNEYTEDQVDQLAIDLGCTTAVSLKSADADEDLAGVIEQLKALMAKAHKSAEARK